MSDEIKTIDDLVSGVDEPDSEWLHIDTYHGQATLLITSNTGEIESSTNKRQDRYPEYHGLADYEGTNTQYEIMINAGTDDVEELRKLSEMAESAADYLEECQELIDDE